MNTLIKATNLRGYDKLTAALGGDPVSLLKKHHLPVESERDENAFLILRNMMLLLEDTASTLGCHVFGLQLASYQGITILGPISVIARSSATVGDAISNISHYLHQHCPALKMSTTKHVINNAEGKLKTIKLEYQMQTKGVDYSVQCYELGLANGMQIFKLLCGEDFHPISTHFLHKKSSYQVNESEDIYQITFQSPIYFNQDWCGFILPESVFHKPLSSEDKQTCQLAKQYLDSQQEALPESISEEVKRLTRSLLPIGQCNIDTIASHLYMHKRTLQRKLAEENITYDQLLAAERKVLAKKYLMDPNFKLSQISGLLGYSEQATFNRACKSWFGATPKEVRRELLD
ncbi:MAG: AraC family transcriptional regulator ligand-binding domain-containing protein [Vibrio sp.]